MLNKKSIRDIDVAGKKVFIRVDYNVPMDKAGNITEDTRIRATLPTLNYLLEKNAAIIIASHLGRPKGAVVPEFSLAPVELGTILTAAARDLRRSPFLCGPSRVIWSPV